MSSSFFLKKGSKPNNKRKFQSGATSTSKKNQKNSEKSAPIKKRPQKKDEEISSDDEVDSEIEGKPGVPNLTFSSDEGEQETPQDKRLRLAKQYLKEIANQEAERTEERELHDHVSKRLQTEYLDSVGKLRKSIAASITGYNASNTKILKHKRQHLSISSLALSADGKYIFSGGKSQFVLKWNLETNKIEGSFDVQPHTQDAKKDIKRRSHVVALCLSTDMKFLALAEGGRNIQIWCPRELKHLKTFTGHRDIVTTLVFRRDTHELYSGSRDRSVKIWSLDEMAYVESLFGHQAGVTGIDALSRERAVTAGGSDRSLRVWKITEESQLIYNASSLGSIDHVKFLNDENFVSASDDGSLSLWSALRKKATCVKSNVHGIQINGDANWITAIACVVNTDLIATGSYDGVIRLWQVADNSRSLKEILQIPLTGFVNSLAFDKEGTKLYAAVGQEHRLGRWWCIKEAKNHIVIFDLLRNTVNSAS